VPGRRAIEQTGTTGDERRQVPGEGHGSTLIERREPVFLLLAGFFLCAMTLLNVIGITRFIELGRCSSPWAPCPIA
jgi:hypothetical protein